jgi:hypothetical protein
MKASVGSNPVRAFLTISCSMSMVTTHKGISVQKMFFVAACDEHELQLGLFTI